jgi:hypothetical protein
MARFARRQPRRVPQDRKVRFRLSCRQLRHPGDLVLPQFLLVVEGLEPNRQGAGRQILHEHHPRPDRWIAEGFDYYNQFLKDGDNPKSNLSICLWGAPEIVEDMVSGNAAIASVPDAVGVQIVNTFKQRFPGKPVPFAAAPHPADVNGLCQRRFLAVARSRSAPTAGMSMQRGS